jgi:hypothetical protein
LRASTPTFRRPCRSSASAEAASETSVSGGARSSMKRWSHKVAARSRRRGSEWAVSFSGSVEPCSCAGCAGLSSGSFGRSVFAGMGCGVPTYARPAGGLPGLEKLRVLSSFRQKTTRRSRHKEKRLTARRALAGQEEQRPDRRATARRRNTERALQAGGHQFDPGTLYSEVCGARTSVRRARGRQDRPLGSGWG